MKRKINMLVVFCLIFALTFSFNTASVYATEKSEKIYVIPGGEPFGIKMFSEGLLIINIESFETEKGDACPAQKCGLKINDVIYAADGAVLYSNKDLKTIIENSSGEAVKLKIKRNDKYMDIYLTPVIGSDGIYKAGMWVKDSAAGLGTISFYSEDRGLFCGLGHGICDQTTKSLMPISYGEIDKAFISSVTMSKSGDVGTLNGYFTDEVLGKAYKNQNDGIYGKISGEISDKNMIELGHKDDTVCGKAQIITTISGETPKLYDIEIVKINRNSETINMTIKITDKELLENTGGIVQGMSGSPIIQNNKLVGVVTHVIIDNPCCGYAIYAETMYKEMVE